MGIIGPIFYPKSDYESVATASWSGTILRGDAICALSGLDDPVNLLSDFTRPAAIPIYFLTSFASSMIMSSS